MPNKENPKIAIGAEWFEKFDRLPEPIRWERELLASNVTTHKDEHSKEIILHANLLFDNHGEKKYLTYPILANFQINRTNAQVKKVNKSWKKMSRLEKGYYAALGESVDFTGVYEWLYSYDTKVKDKTEFKGTREAMYKAIKTAIPFIKEIEYNSKYEEFEVLVNFEDGQQVERKLSSNLSDGMKAMLYLVSEIAYRCIMLNGKLGTHAVNNSAGIVLIDELDMHLHPNWQRQVVQNLKDAFPNIQFVVTTHSPFIVQSIEADELINLDIESTISPKDLSVDLVSHEIMGVDSNYSTKNAAKEAVSTDYFQLLEEASTQQNKFKFITRLEALENSISDPGLRAFLRMNRIAKNIL